jgi:hypothetical protein
MDTLSADEHFKLTGETKVLALLHEFGLSDWPAYYEDEGVLVRAVSHHETR